jgi:hypothetical protein
VWIECYTYKALWHVMDEIFPVGVWCEGAVSRRDLQRIKGAGFNSVWSGRPDAGLAGDAAAVGLKLMAAGAGHAEIHADAAAGAADLRLWGWTALLRGARAVAFYAWRDLVASDAALTARGRAAAEFAGVLSRNPALFAPLRPRATTDPGSMTADLRISAGAGEVEAGFLESREALVLVVVNHAGAPKQVTLTFASGTKQEFWQNLETGDMESFAMVNDAPTLTHAFAARDAMVLMIRKTSPYDRR